MCVCINIHPIALTSQPNYLANTELRIQPVQGIITQLQTHSVPGILTDLMILPVPGILTELNQTCSRYSNKVKDLTCYPNVCSILTEHIFTLFSN